MSSIGIFGWVVQSLIFGLLCAVMGVGSRNRVVCFSSARHGRCRYFLLAEVRHAVFGDEVIAGD